MLFEIARRLLRIPVEPGFVYTKIALRSTAPASEDLTNVADYLVGAGDVLYYDVMWLDSQAFIGLELEASDGTALRNLGVVDQNGYGSPATSLPDSLVLNRWYRRAIKLDALAGKTLWRYGLFCEADASGTFRGRIANAAIVGPTGVVRLVIFNETTADPIGYLTGCGTRPSTTCSTSRKVSSTCTSNRASRCSGTC